MKITLKSLISQHGERSELCLMKNYDPIKRGKMWSWNNFIHFVTKIRMRYFEGFSNSVNLHQYNFSLP